jgi:phosphate-selective porin O/P
MRCHHAMRIILAVLAIWGAVFTAQAANVAVNATREVPSEQWVGGAIPSVAQSRSSSDAKAGDLQGSKAPPGTDRKQEAAVPAGSNGGGGTTSPDTKVGDLQGSKAAPGTDPKQEVAVQPGSNGAGGGTNSAKPTASNSSNSKNVEDSQGSKTAPETEPKQEAAVPDGSNGAGGATNSAKPTARYSYNSENFTFAPRFRLQLRYIHDTVSGKDEFFVARLRLKAKGELFHIVRYYAEYKFDTLGRPGKDPTHGFENAWLEYSLAPNFIIRGGQYDVPFSRNALTSDSKLLFIDRSLIKDQLTSFGFADNTVGLLGHGRPFKGRFEYSAGIFNNEKFRRFHAPGANRSDHLMPAARFVYHFLDPAPRGGYADYYSSYVGKGKRLSIGANSAYLSKARDTVNEFNLLGWGTDLFFSNGPFSAEAEYDQLRKKLIANPDIQMDGWYAQAGYLVRGRVEFAVRHQQLDRDVSVSNNQLRWTTVGSNIYFQKHHVKLQFDYTFRRGPGQAVKTDVLQIQTQLDY